MVLIFIECIRKLLLLSEHGIFNFGASYLICVYSLWYLQERTEEKRTTSKNGTRITGKTGKRPHTRCGESKTIVCVWFILFGAINMI